MDTGNPVLTKEQAELGMAFITAGFGIIKELHFVSKYTAMINIAGYFFILSTVPTNSENFFLATGFFMTGLAFIINDARKPKNRRKKLVAFLAGSKTLGSLGIYIGFVENNLLISPYVYPHLLSIIQYFQGNSFIPTSDQLNIYSFIIILAIVHGLGGICWLISWIIHPNSRH